MYSGFIGKILGGTFRGLAGPAKESSFYAAKYAGTLAFRGMAGGIIGGAYGANQYNRPEDWLAYGAAGAAIGALGGPALKATSRSLFGHYSKRQISGATAPAASTLRNWLADYGYTDVAASTAQKYKPGWLGQALWGGGKGIVGAAGKRLVGGRQAWTEGFRSQIGQTLSPSGAKAPIYGSVGYAESLGHHRRSLWNQTFAGRTTGMASEALSRGFEGIGRMGLVGETLGGTLNFMAQHPSLTLVGGAGALTASMFMGGGEAEMGEPLSIPRTIAGSVPRGYYDPSIMGTQGLVQGLHQGRHGGR